jgi:hypothetical protein
MKVCYDGTYWNAFGTGVAASGSGGSSALTNITSSLTFTGCTITGNLCKVGSSTSQVGISALPSSGYNDIKIVYTGTNTTSGWAGITLGLNGDTGANYEYALWAVNGSTDYRSGNHAQTSGFICALGASGYGGGGEIDIPQYTNTSFKKSAQAVCTTETGGSNYTENDNASAYWASTAAITSIQLNAVNWSANDTIVVYGVN